MRIKEALRVINEEKPKSRKAFKDLGFELEFLDAGAFRDVYRIKDTQLVVKFPKPESQVCLVGSGKAHSRIEYEWVIDLTHNPRWKPIRKFMPKIYYYDPKGIVVMKYYRPAECTPEVGVLAQALESLLMVIYDQNDVHNDASDSKCWDLGYSNLGVDSNGQYKIIDLGYFE